MINGFFSNVPNVGLQQPRVSSGHKKWKDREANGGVRNVF